MAGPRRGPGTGNSPHRAPTTAPWRADAIASPSSEDASPPDEADLYTRVLQLLTDAGLYNPASETHDLLLTAHGQAVVIGWSEATAIPGSGTRRAIRFALLEILTAAGLDARYEPPAGRRTGTVIVTRPHPDARDESTPYSPH